METTLFLIKPDGVKRNLYEIIINKIESQLQIVTIFKPIPNSNICKLHYIEHKNKYFYEELCTFMSSGPIVAIIAKGHDAVKIGRNIVKSIRFTYVHPKEVMENVIHASDSIQNAKREIVLWFGQKERFF